jgi:hypothetical protein
MASAEQAAVVGSEKRIKKKFRMSEKSQGYMTRAAAKCLALASFDIVELDFAVVSGNTTHDSNTTKEFLKKRERRAGAAE